MNPKLAAIADTIRTSYLESGGNIYHPLPFPEFSGITTSSDSKAAYHKWELIRRALGSPSSLKGFRVLDVGANAGLYTFSFAKLGAEVDSFEPHARYASLGRQITDATGLQVNWYEKALEAADIEGRQYDIVLLLSVFQWMSRGNEHLEEATVLLRKLAASSRMVFFELGCNHGKSAIHTDERPIGWVWRLLRKNTAPKQPYYLGTTTAWGRAKRYVFVSSAEPVHLNLWQRLVTQALRRGLAG